MEKASTSKKPMANHLRVFGSLCQVHMEEWWKTLGSRSEQVVLLGYHSTRGSKLIDPKDNMVIIGSDVIVDETRTRNWVEKEKSDEKQRSLLLEIEGESDPSVV